MDWYKARDGVEGFSPKEDPGVISVTSIYNYYKKHGYDTIVMGASFRNIQEIQELAGCDKLTIAPKLLDALKACSDPLEQRLSKDTATEACDMDKVSLTEGQFREMLNGDAMATEKLAEGIRGFSADLVKLEGVLKQKLAGAGGSQYDQLNAYTNIVCDTGDINAIKKFMPVDATTNPSLLYKAAQMEEYAGLVNEAVEYAKAQKGSDEFKLALMIDKMSVNFGCEILKVVPGYVSTEVDARLSFDAEETKFRARRIIDMYKAAGYPKERVLIKIASTWEGIKACEELQKEGIVCNMTLLFSFEQAAACAEAKATLISPFVGRIMDFYKKAEKVDGYTKFEDPGVISVSRIYAYYKKYGYDTIVMGASFRNIGEIQALAGCDKLTIAPKLLDELKACNDPLPRILSTEESPAKCTDEKVHMSEGLFRLGMNQNAMATSKLAEGIRGFSKDLVSLEGILKSKLA
jgi:transaldolase